MHARDVDAPNTNAVGSGGRVVVTGRIPDAGLVVLRAAGHRVDVWEGSGPIERQDLLRLVAGADALVTLLTERVDAELLDAAGPQLRVVANVAVGYNNLDVSACSARGIVAANTPGVLTDATADIAMALILMTTRRLAEAERLVRSGEAWQWGMFMMLGSGIQGRRLGVVGMGQIGVALARRARAFGMTVSYNNRRRIDSALEREFDAQFLPFDELLATSDVVSLHCPYGAATHYLIDDAELRTMPASAYLINTARGPVIHEAALVAALERGEIAGAGLDVYEEEPAIHPGLLHRDDVVLLPHLGSATQETRAAMASLAARNAVAVLAGHLPLTPLN